MALTLPTLTDRGLVTDKNILMKDIFRYFITTQKSQSTIYEDIESYDYIMKMYSSVPLDLKIQMTKSLTSLYGRYFDTTEVNIQVINDTMNIDIGAKDIDGVIYKLSSNTANDIITNIDDIVKLYE